MDVDLSTHYLGLKLANPVVVSACPLTGELDVLRQLEDYGAAAAVFPSLFEEQFDGKPREAHPSAVPAAAPLQRDVSFRELAEYNRGPEEYLKHLARARRAVSIPLVGSLNASTPGDWLHHARRIEEAGANALELNVYFLAADFETTSREIEARYIELVAGVRREISIPLAVKIGPYFTALPNMARRFVDAGADGLVLFNRFVQPEIDLEALEIVPRLSLSTPHETREALRWIALLHGRLEASLAATTGVDCAEDALRLILAGADAVMVASALYRHGIGVLRTLVDGVSRWLAAKEFCALEQVKGMLSSRRCPNPEALVRADFAKANTSYASGAGT